MSHQRTGIGRASELAGLFGRGREGGGPASLGGVRRDHVRGVHGLFRLLDAAGHMPGMGDDRERRAESVPAGKRRAVSIPRRFTGHGSGGGRSRKGRVDRGFRTDDSGEGEGEVGRFTGVGSKEEGENRRDRNERIRSDILGVRLGSSFRVYIRVEYIFEFFTSNSRVKSPYKQEERKRK
jgi:hypothetical protein